MKHVTTYLHFNGNCRQAMEFYQKSLGAELQLNAYPDSEGKPSTAPDARIMHSHLMMKGQPILMASDSGPGGDVHIGTNFSVCIECDSVEEIDRLFAAIGQGGQVRMPLGDVPWGARFGMLTDQFGIQWFFNHTLSK